MTYYTAPGIYDPVDLIAATQFECKVKDLYDQSKRKPQVTARQFVIWYKCKRMKQHPIDMARHFGIHHTTVDYALKRVPEWVKVNRDFRERFNAAIKLLEK